MARGLSIPSCSHCAQDSIVHQRYSGQNLCAKHLEQSIRKKFNKALREQLTIPKKEQFKILVAISGGKDSAVLLERMYHAVGKIPHVEIISRYVHSSWPAKGDVAKVNQPLCDVLKAEANPKATLITKTSNALADKSRLSPHHECVGGISSICFV